MDKNSIDYGQRKSFLLLQEFCCAQNGPLLLTYSLILEQESRAVSDMNLKDKSSSGDTQAIAYVTGLTHSFNFIGKNNETGEKYLWNWRRAYFAGFTLCLKFWV